MSTERKYKTVWEHRNPGKPLPSDEEFRQMREQALADWDRMVAEDPSILDRYQYRRCTCCDDVDPSADHHALSD